MKGALSLLALPLLAAASPVKTGVFDDKIAPLVSSENAKAIPDSYIVVFKKHVTHSLAAEHHGWVQDLHTTVQKKKRSIGKRSQVPFVDTVFEGLRHTYNIGGNLLGYAGHFDEDVLAEIRRHPDVDFIEKDQEVHTTSSKDTPELEKNAPWGLARISHRDGLTFGTFNKYLHAADGGEGVDVYVIDTGTNVDHVDFEGRASWGKTIPQNDQDVDGNGHGTHCSGTVAGKKYGVAKKANVIAVKVLRSNGSGSMSDVVKGVEFAAESHTKSIKAQKKNFKGSAANMSLGGGKSTLLDKAVNAAVDAGIHFAVAAGNDNADSCRYSPAAAEKAVTVGASNLADERAFFSNYGKCNDIFAPGLNIESTWIGSKYAINTISGTSMASPHIAGLLAYLLSLQPSKDSAYAVAEISPKELKANLLAISTKGALTDVPSDTANLLAWNGGGSSNFTEIVDKGGYNARSTSTPSKHIKLPSLKDVENAIEEMPKLSMDKDTIKEVVGEVVDEVFSRIRGSHSIAI
ncbi:serine protease thp 1 [Elsinoe ampelina]|uniref:Serine protease thp 1 n=1 Tax=Elsinoe ampelina TaxID=302913 RepID=A0A6A6G7N3_9PEZI|nr:serine protease thp 1 [Elsinoe ampelina]